MPCYRGDSEHKLYFLPHHTLKEITKVWEKTKIPHVRFALVIDFVFLPVFTCFFPFAFKIF